MVWRQRVSVPGFSLSWWPILAGRRGLWRVDCGISLSGVVLGILLVPYEYLDGEFGGCAGSGLGADWQRHTLARLAGGRGPLGGGRPRDGLGYTEVSRRRKVASRDHHVGYDVR